MNAPTTIGDDRLVSDDGTVLYMKSWPERNELRAILYFVHGLGEHVNRYERLFDHFNERGIRVYGFDQRGHGRTCELNRSRMVRGHLGSLSLAMKDVDALVKQGSHGNTPRFLMGHSMGGLIVLEWALDPNRTQGLSGVIASAPALKPGTRIPRAKLFLGRLFSHAVPRLTIDNGLDASNISRITAEVDDFMTDQLCHHRISLQTATSILDVGEEIMKKGRENRMEVPLLVTHGMADIMTCPSTSALFVESLQCPDKTHQAFPNAYHNRTILPLTRRTRTLMMLLVHLDLTREEVVELYCQWMFDRSDGLTSHHR